jgi:hypothetical protein
MFEPNKPVNIEQQKLNMIMSNLKEIIRAVGMNTYAAYVAQTTIDNLKGE